MQISQLQNHNKSQWLENVRPGGRMNPIPKKVYDLVVVGGGSAGLVSAGAAAMLGFKTALIEADKLGGDCLNNGCVPSKALLQAAKSGYLSGKSSENKSEFFADAVKSVHKTRAQISPHDAVTKFEKMGVDVFFGKAGFDSGRKIMVNNSNLPFRRCILATGSVPAIPSIPGLEKIPYYTNENIFELEELPERLCILGGGPVGIEMAQAFQRLGSRVTVLQKNQSILPKESKTASAYIHSRLHAEGVHIITSAKGVKVEEKNGKKYIHYTSDNVSGSQEFDVIFIAAGRKPGVPGLNLSRAGIRFDEKKGILVDEKLKTSNSHVYAVGDVTPYWNFTHAADAMARMAIQNALMFGRKSVNDLTVPWVTYTDPEVAHVGLTPEKARKKNISFDLVCLDYGENDRCIIEKEHGFGEVLVSKTGKILGATLVHPLAGEMINTFTLAIDQNISVTKLSSIIHPYPTRSELNRKFGDEWMTTKIKPGIKAFLKTGIAVWRQMSR